MSNKSFTINEMPRGCSQGANYGHILTFAQVSGWIGRCYEMISGNALSRCCQGRKVILAVPPGITDALLRRFSGLCARAVRGATYRKHWGIGTAPMFASRAGARRVSGNGLRRLCAAKPIWSICSSTQPSFVPTNIRRGPKKNRSAGNRPLAGRTDHQTAYRRGCLGQSAAGDSFRRSDGRHRTGGFTDQGSAGPIHRSRQGLRFGCLHRNDLGAGEPRGHPTTIQSSQPENVRPAHLQVPQPDRAFLLPYQAIQTYRHTLRQTCQLIPGVRSSGLRHRMADLIENRP